MDEPPPQAAAASDDGYASIGAASGRTATEARRALLDRASRLVATCLSVEEVCRRLAELSVPVVADGCVIYLLDGSDVEAGPPRMTVIHGDPNLGTAIAEEVAGSVEGAPGLPVSEVLRSGRPLLVPEVALLPTRHLPQQENQASLVECGGVNSLLVVPLVGRAGTVGALAFVSTASGRRFGPADLALAGDLATRLGPALENARLFEAEQSARARTDTVQRRLVAQAELSRVLATSLEPEEVLSDLSRLVVPTFADHCLLDLVEPDGSIRRVPTTADPERLPLGSAAVLSRHPPDPANRFHPAVRAIASGEPQLLAELGESELGAIAVDPKHWAATRAVRPTSALSVPLPGRGRVLGALTFITTEVSGRRLQAGDVPPAEEVGRRVGIALDNARSFARERALAQSLQISEERYRSLVEATSALVWTTDAAGMFVEPQPGWEAYTGQSWPEAEGFGWTAALHPDDRQMVVDTWQQARSSGSRYECSARIWHAPSGEYRHAVARGAPLRSERGEIREWVGNVTDVHDQVIARREAGERAQHLLELTADLAAAGSEEEIADLLAGRLPQVLGADTFALGRVDEQRGRIVPVRMAGFSPEFVAVYGEIPLDRPSAAVDVVRSGQPLFLSSAAEYLARYPELAGWREANRLESWAHVPLVAEQEAIGLVHVGFRRQRELPEAERVFLETVVAAAGQAWQRAGILRAERAAARRLRQVQELSDIALGMLALPELLEALLPRLRAALDVDAGRIFLAGDEGPFLELAASVGDDGESIEVGQVIGFGEGFAGAVATLRAPLTSAEEAVGPGAGSSGGPAPDPLASRVGVPLLVGARLVGVLDVGTYRSRTFSDDDVKLLELAAERIAVAIDRTRASDLQRELAQTLQASLLPPTVPVIPGVEVATCYRAAGEGTEVGGDFYDLFPDGHGGWYLVIGDVCGRGVAAAGLTGLARHTVRIVAPERRSPAAILARLNQVLADATDDEHFATVACARLTRTPSGLQMVVASGGHCPVVLRRGGGVVEPVRVAGRVLGAFPEVDLSEVVIELAAGEAAVFHTDGVTEARGEDGEFGDRRLAEVVAQVPGGSAAEVSSALEQAVLSHAGGRVSDDLAIVVVRPSLGRLVVDLDMVLGAEAPSRGRHSLESLREQLPAPVMAVARLIVSELVTNAVRHGEHAAGATSSGDLRVWLRPGRLRMEVTSPGSFDDLPGAGPVLAEGGRGLQIVRAVAADLGIEHVEGEAVVWAEIDLAAS